MNLASWISLKFFIKLIVYSIYVSLLSLKLSLLCISYCNHCLGFIHLSLPQIEEFSSRANRKKYTSSTLHLKKVFMTSFSGLVHTKDLDFRSITCIMSYKSLLAMPEFIKTQLLSHLWRHINAMTRHEVYARGYKLHEDNILSAWFNFQPKPTCSSTKQWWILIENHCLNAS